MKELISALIAIFFGEGADRLRVPVEVGTRLLGIYDRHKDVG